MYVEDARKLQKKWGNNPCDHPDIIAARVPDGSNTDTWHCTNAAARWISVIGKDTRLSFPSNSSKGRF
jgi:hypothetical protein